jgi:hypothetical protein
MPTPQDECEQTCFDLYCKNLESAKDKSVRWFLFVPYTDDDVFNELKQAAREKYERGLEACKRL